MNAKAPTALRGERGPPPHFAGRHAELSLMRRRLEATLSARHPEADGLLLFTGIPGIGKTHLAYHFVQQQKAAQHVPALVLGAEELAYPEGMILRIGRAMGAEEAFAKATGIGRRVSGARASVAGVDRRRRCRGGRRSARRAVVAGGRRALLRHPVFSQLHGSPRRGVPRTLAGGGVGPGAEALSLKASLIASMDGSAGAFRPAEAPTRHALPQQVLGRGQRRQHSVAQG